MDPYGQNNNYRGNAHIQPSVFISSRKAHYRNDNSNSPNQQSLQSNTTLPTTNSSPYLHQQNPPVTNASKPVVKRIYIGKIPRPPPNADVQIEPDKPKKIYEVVPPIEISQLTNIPLVLPTKAIEQTNSGQYHYPPEIEETEIKENDPENNDAKSIVGELPELGPPELLSLEQFRCEQSPLPYDRVLIVVPEYVDNMERKLTETTTDFPQSNPVDTDMARSLFVPSKNSELSNKLKILNFPALIRTAPKIKLPPVPKPKPASEPPPPVPKPKSPPKPKPVSQPPPPVPKPKVVLKPIEVPNKIKPNLTNTMLHKPVKHTRVAIEAEKKPSPPPAQKAIVKTKNNIDVDKTYFFSDFGKESEGDEEVISIDSIPFVLPTQSEITSDDNTSSVVVRQTRPSPPTNQNNNKRDKEKTIQRINATKKHSITSIPKLPAKKSVPISTHAKMKTKFPWEDTDSNENQVDMFGFGFNIGAFELPRENGTNN